MKDSFNDLDKAEEILSGLLMETKGDKGTWERTRLLRLPGTLNYKVPENPKQVTIRENNGLRYEIKDFEAYRVIGLKKIESKQIVFDKNAPIFGINNLMTSKMSPEILNLIRDRDTKGEIPKE